MGKLLDNMTARPPARFVQKPARFVQTPEPKEPAYGFYVPRQTALTNDRDGNYVTRFCMKGWPIGVWR